MKLTIAPSEEEIMALIPRRVGVEIKINRHELSVTGLTPTEENALEAEIKTLYGKRKT